MGMLYEENAFLHQDQELHVVLTTVFYSNYYGFLLGILKIYNPCMLIYLHERLP